MVAGNLSADDFFSPALRSQAAAFLFLRFFLINWGAPLIHFLTFLFSNPNRSVHL